MDFSKNEKRQATIEEITELQKIADLALAPVPITGNTNQHRMTFEDLKKATNAFQKIADLQKNL